MHNSLTSVGWKLCLPWLHGAGPLVREETDHRQAKLRGRRTELLHGVVPPAERASRGRAAATAACRGARPPAADGQAGARHRLDLKGASVGQLPPPLGPTGYGGSGGQPAMEGAGSRVRPAMEGSEERDSTEGNGERGAPGALAPGGAARAERSGRGGARQRAREGGGEWEICYIYQWQKRVILYKLDGEVRNPDAQKLGKLLPPSFSTVGKN